MRTSIGVSVLVLAASLASPASAQMMCGRPQAANTQGQNQNQGQKMAMMGCGMTGQSTSGQGMGMMQQQSKAGGMCAGCNSGNCPCMSGMNQQQQTPAQPQQQMPDMK